MADRCVRETQEVTDDELTEFERSGAYQGARRSLDHGVRDMYDYVVRKMELTLTADGASDVDVRSHLRAVLKAFDSQGSSKFIDDPAVADAVLWTLVEALELLVRYVRG